MRWIGKSMISTFDVMIGKGIFIAVFLNFGFDLIELPNEILIGNYTKQRQDGA